MRSQPFGLTPVDANTLYIALGAGKALTYGEVGFQVSATMGHRISEAAYWPAFLRACSRGLVSYQSWDDLGKHRLTRTVVECPKAVEAIRDIQIALGGDYSYYRYFDPYEDYEKNPHKLDPFMKRSFNVAGRERGITKKKLFEKQWKRHQKDPDNFRWFGK